MKEVMWLQSCSWLNSAEFDRWTIHMGSVVTEICPIGSTYGYTHPAEVLFVSSICGLGVPSVDSTQMKSVKSKSLLTGMRSCPGAEYTLSVTCMYNAALHYWCRDIGCAFHRVRSTSMLDSRIETQAKCDVMRLVQKPGVAVDTGSNELGPLWKVHPLDKHEINMHNADTVLDKAPGSGGFLYSVKIQITIHPLSTGGAILILVFQNEHNSIIPISQGT